MGQRTRPEPSRKSGSVSRKSGRRRIVNAATDWNMPPPGLNLRDWFDRSDIDAIVKLAGVALPAGEDVYERYYSAGEYPDPDDRVVRGPRADVLVRRLNDHVGAYSLQLALQKAPTDRQAAKRFGEIERKAAALLNALGTPNGDPGEMPSQLREGSSYLRGASLQRQADLDAEREFSSAPSGAARLVQLAVIDRKRLNNAVAGIAAMQRWARGARLALRREHPMREAFGADRKSRGNPDGALNYLIMLLRDTYAASWGAGSSGADKPAIVAPFIHAVLTCLHNKKQHRHLLPEVPTVQAIVQRVRRDG